MPRCYNRLSRSCIFMRELWRTSAWSFLHKKKKKKTIDKANIYKITSKVEQFQPKVLFFSFSGRSYIVPDRQHDIIAVWTRKSLPAVLFLSLLCYYHHFSRDRKGKKRKRKNTTQNIVHKKCCVSLWWITDQKSSRVKSILLESVEIRRKPRGGRSNPHVSFFFFLNKTNN